MSDNRIVITMVGFPSSYPVTLFSKDGATGQSVPLENLAIYVAELANKYNVKDIKILGTQSYAAPVVDDILEFSKMKYANNDLRIEVIPQWDI